MHLDRGADDPLHDLVDGWIVRPNYRRVAEALRSQTFRRGAPDNFWPAHLGSSHFKSPKPISTSIPACLDSFARQGRSKVEQSPKKRKESILAVQSRNFYDGGSLPYHRRLPNMKKVAIA